jgi:hypothetical protein
VTTTYADMRDMLLDGLVAHLRDDTKAGCVMASLDHLIDRAAERETWLLGRVKDQEAALRELVRMTGESMCKPRVLVVVDGGMAEPCYDHNEVEVMVVDVDGAKIGEPFSLSSPWRELAAEHGVNLPPDTEDEEQA